MEQILYQLKMIRLSGMANGLSIRLQEAQANDLSYLDFLTNLVQDELLKRQERLLNRRLKSARLPELKTLDTFDFSFNPAIRKKTIMDLAACRFIQNNEPVILLGPPGVGKTHLAIGLAIAAVEKGFTVIYRSIFDLAEELAEATALGQRKQMIHNLVKPDLLVVDEFGMRNLAPTAAEDLLEIIHRRYRHGSTLIATNRPLEDWGKLLGDNAATSAILDRMMHTVHMIMITGRSYRLKHADEKEQKELDNESKKE